jgi:hypothetical protein
MLIKKTNLNNKTCCTLHIIEFLLETLKMKIKFLLFFSYFLKLNVLEFGDNRKSFSTIEIFILFLLLSLLLLMILFQLTLELIQYIIVIKRKLI